MILADTSVWIDHLRTGSTRLAALLNEGSILIHPFIVGELACGNLKSRNTVLSSLAALPHAVSATHEEALNLIENRRLSGRGMGWIDAHLVTSTLLTQCELWTADRRLEHIALRAGVRLYKPL